ncbi:MAG: response regulator [Myxococcaceae bacterium]
MPPLPKLSASPMLASGRNGSGSGISERASPSIHAALLGQTTAPSILVVEPDPRTRSVLGAALVKAGLSVIAVANAEEALRQLTSDRGLPSVIVSEVDLAGLDGFGLCSQLRSELRTAHLPVLLLARKAEPMHRELATGAGADDFLPKPVFVNDIVSHVQLRASPRGMDGSYRTDTRSLPVPVLLRALLAGVRSGRVDLLEGRARISFRDGRVVGAALEKQQGEAALLRILLLAEGAYQVSFGPALEQGVFTLDGREFYDRLHPRALRWRECLARSVPLSAVLGADFAKFTQSLGQLPEGLEGIVRLFDGTRTVLQVILESPVEEVLTLEVITRLHELGVIAPLPATEYTRYQRSAPQFFEPRAVSSQPSEDALPAELQRQLDAFNIRPVVEVARASAKGKPAVIVYFHKSKHAVEMSKAPLARMTSPAPASTCESESDDIAAQAAQAHFYDELPTPVALAQVQVPSLVQHPSHRLRNALLALSGFLIAVSLMAFTAWRVYQHRIPEATNAVLVAAGLQPIATSNPPPITPAQPSAEALVANEEVLAPDTALLSARSLDEDIQLYEAGHAKEAANALTEWVQEDKSNPTAWLFLGLARFDSSDNVGAEQAALESLALDPSNGRAVLLLASIYLDAGNRTEAHAQLKYYLQLDPQGQYADEARQLLQAR